MHYEATMYSFRFSSLSYVLLLLIQTLITLNLYENNVGDEGIKSLANALKTNKVMYFTYTTHR
jgi:hypothetical protein